MEEVIDYYKITVKLRDSQRESIGVWKATWNNESRLVPSRYLTFYKTELPSISDFSLNELESFTVELPCGVDLLGNKHYKTYEK